MQNELVLTSRIDLENLIRGCIKDELSVLKKDAKSDSSPTSEILSIKEASEFLNLAKPTIYTLTSKREIPFFKNGKKLYFKRTELVQWIEQGKQKTVAEERQDMESYLSTKKKGGKSW